MLRSLSPTDSMVAELNTVDRLAKERVERIKNSRERQEAMDREIARLEQQREMRRTMSAYDSVR